MSIANGVTAVRRVFKKSFDPDTYRRPRLIWYRTKKRLRSKIKNVCERVRIVLAKVAYTIYSAFLKSINKTLKVWGFILNALISMIGILVGLFIYFGNIPMDNLTSGGDLFYAVTGNGCAGRSRNGF